MVMKKIISTLLAVLMLAGTCSFMVGAEGVASNFTPEYNTSSNVPTIGYLSSTLDYFDTTSDIIDTEEEKLETMDCRLEKDGYRLYVDAYSGEVAVECIDSGEIMFTNPYNLSQTTANWATKIELLSQLVVNFKDITTGQTTTYHSGTWAVGKAYTDKGVTVADEEEIEASQIVVRNIKNGLRVEYTIGREQSKMLVPRVITKEAYETKILAPLLEALEVFRQEVIAQKLAEGMSQTRAESAAEAEYNIKYGKFKFYKLYDPATYSADEFKVLQQKVGFSSTQACYILEPDLKSTERARIEQRVKQFIPAYTYEELDSDHLTMGYVDQDKNPPLFNMALEYTLDSQGLSVRLPANGISFNESLYELLSVEILPYMGAGFNKNGGYTFFPDGSGTLFDFEQIANLGTNMTVTGKVYGQDFAYHTISGAHQETIRYPVFGIVEEEETFVRDPYSGEPVIDRENSTSTNTVFKMTTQNRGFVAIVEDGDAMMELVASHETTTSGFNTVKMRVYPRPQDTYNVADAISVGSNDTWTVVSSRKYTGSYKIRYIMLTPEDTAPDTIETFDASYVGMAMAYRKYLENKGTLTKLTAADIDANNIPMFIETFGSMQTTERFLSIPVDVMTPLTTFEDIKLMYQDLSAVGVGNLNFILTGFTSGGMTRPTVPYNLSWEGVLEQSAQTDKEAGYANRENMTFAELVAFSQDEAHAFGLFPDFDFAFVKNDVWFDGLSLDQHAVKTIDDRYTSKREYSATKQTYISHFELALSPAYFNHFYDKLTQNFKNYLGYGEGEKAPGISVSTLGTYLNSDFDEEEPYNRADAKAFTIYAFEHFANNYEKVMTAGGNAYSWKYVDYITDIALDSSRYSDSAASVPFLGMVLHGYVEFAGSPINMEGNLDYAILKTIESGAGLQFILSYRNTQNLKENDLLSQYYSINYEIWKEDVASIYNEVNSILKDLQTSTIEEHTFIDGVRVPDNDELRADAEAAVNALIAAEAAKREAEAKKMNYNIMKARKLLKGELLTINDAMTKSDPANPQNTYMDAYDKLTGMNGNGGQKQLFEIIMNAYENLNLKKEEYKAAKAVLDGMSATDPNYSAQLALVESAKEALDTAQLTVDSSTSTPSSALNDLEMAARAAMKSLYGYLNNYELARDCYEIMVEQGIFTSEQAQLKATLDACTDAYNALLPEVAKIYAITDAAYDRYMTMYPTADVEKFVYDNNPEAEDAEDDTDASYSKYQTADNKIVYEEFSNGTAFILNFNDYAVVVTNPKTGITYTIEAYGYVVLKPQNNA